MRWNKIFLTVAAIALASSASAEGWSQLKGHSSAIKQARETVILNSQQWQAFWKEHTAENPAPLPAVDFSKEAVIAIFAGQRFRGGYEVVAQVLGDEKANDLTVLYQVREPKDKVLAIACPKLDDGREIYVDKIVSLIDEAKINTLTVAIMEVPCCGGLLHIAKQAAAKANRKVPIKCMVVEIHGAVKSEEWVNQGGPDSKK